MNVANTPRASGIVTRETDFVHQNSFDIVYGKANHTITLDTYAHVLETMQQEAVDTLNDIL